METAKAQAQLRALQTQVASLNKTMAASAGAGAGGLFSGAAMASGAAGAKGMTQTLVQTKNAAAALDSQLAGSARGMNASLKTMRQAFAGEGAAMKLASPKSARNVGNLSASWKKCWGYVSANKNNASVRYEGCRCWCSKIADFF